MDLFRFKHRSHHTAESAAPDGALPLSQIEAGQTVRLVALEGCPTVRRRLAELGLNIGMPVRVVQGGGGMIILAVKHDGRLALGRGLAHHILVHPIDII